MVRKNLNDMIGKTTTQLLCFISFSLFFPFNHVEGGIRKPGSTSYKGGSFVCSVESGDVRLREWP